MISEILVIFDRIISMKILILSICFVGLHSFSLLAKSTCPTHEEFKNKKNIFVFEEDLNGDGVTELFAMSKDECGIRGCYFSILQKDPKGCHRSIGDFYGNHEVLKEKSRGYKNIKLKRRDSTLNILTYSPYLMKYVSSRK